MADKKKPVMLKLPDNIGTMTRAEIEAWVEKNLPSIQESVLKEGKGDA